MTKPDTNDAMTPQQERAIEALTAGASITDAATTVGVARQTVSGWLNHHHGFKAALNARRDELRQSTVDRLRTLLLKAVDVLEQAVAQNSIPAAVHVLKAAGVYGVPATIGPTDAADVALEAEERESQRFRRQVAL